MVPDLRLNNAVIPKNKKLVEREGNESQISTRKHVEKLFNRGDNRDLNTAGRESRI